MATRPPAKTSRLDDLFPEDDGPSPDELVDFGGETTDAFVARTGAKEPERLAAGDAVPLFRADLRIEKGAAAGLFEVGVPGTDRHFTLYEFELSIARMLDGRRHASGVIENGVRLGIPVDLDGLNKFVRQLWRYGFLAEPGAASPPAEGEEGGWGEREKWDEATRTLFQTGIRLLRQGRPQDAESYLRAVLDADPGNSEATDLLAVIERGESLVASPLGRRPRVTAVPARRGRTLALAAVGLAAAVAAGFLAAHRLRPALVPRVAVPAPAPPPAAAPPPWRTATVVSWSHPRLGGVEAAGAGVVLWRKRSGDRVTSGERIGTLRGRRAGTVRDAPLTAPAAGTLALVVADRAKVAAGAPLASVLDDRIWEVEAFLDGEPPPVDAPCELRGDSGAERARCRLDGASPRDGGSTLSLTLEAGDAPWVGSSRTLRAGIGPGTTAPIGSPIPPVPPSQPTAISPPLPPR